MEVECKLEDDFQISEDQKNKENLNCKNSTKRKQWQIEADWKWKKASSQIQSVNENQLKLENPTKLQKYSLCESFLT